MNLPLRIVDFMAGPFIQVPREVAEVNGWKDGDVLDVRTGPFIMTDRGDIVVRSIRVHVEHEEAKATRRKKTARRKP